MKKITPFGLKIKEIRKSQNKSVRVLSELSGVSHSYISQIENGDRDVPKPELIKKLADGLSVDYFDLMRSAGYMDNEDNKEITIEEIIEEVSPQVKKEYLDLKSSSFSENGYNLDSFSDTFKQEKNLGFILQLLRLFRRIELKDLAEKTQMSIVDLYKFETSQGTPTTKQLITIGKALDIPNLPIWIKDTFGIQLDITDSIIMLSNSKTKIEVDLKDIKFSFSSGKLTYKRIPKEVLRKSLFSIDDLLKQDQYPVYFNKKVLSKFEKDKIIKMIEILFLEVPFKESGEELMLQNQLKFAEKHITK